MSQEPKKLSDPPSKSAHSTVTTPDVTLTEAVSNTADPTSKTTHHQTETHSVPRLHSPVPRAHSPMPRTRPPMPRIHSPLSSASSPSSSSSSATATATAGAGAGAPSSTSRTSIAHRPPVPRIRTGSNPTDHSPVTPMGLGSRKGSVDSTIMTPLSPDSLPPATANSRPSPLLRSSLPPPEITPHTQTSSMVSRSLSREEIINRMEFEQDALVVRLLKEINDLKQENAKLRYQIRRLQRNNNPENSGSTTAATTASGNNYPQYLHVGPSSEESVAVLDDTDRRGSIAASPTAPPGSYGGPHIARSIQATFGIPHGYPKKAESFTPASSAAVARRRSSVSHGSIYPLDVHRIGMNQNSSSVAAAAGAPGSTYPVAEPYNLSAQRKSTRSSSVHTMEGVGRYSLAAAGRDTSAARSQR